MKYLVTKEDAKAILKSILRNHGFVTMNALDLINKNLTGDEKNEVVTLDINKDCDNDVVFGIDDDAKVPYKNYECLFTLDGDEYFEFC